jgi:ribonuclease T1
METTEPAGSVQPGRQRPHWAAIAFYVGLLLLIAWLKYSTVDGGPQRPFPPDAPPKASDRQRAADEQDAKRDDRSPKSRVMRNLPNVDETSAEKTPDLTPQTSSPPEQSAATRDKSKDRDDSLVIHNVRVLDEDRRVVYRGDVDLAPTLKRIESGRRLRFSHDGIVFENRERRLPAKPSGYYREYVQPTPGDNGPGAQRVVLGGEGEVYYSSDHYRTFRRVR